MRKSKTKENIVSNNATFPLWGRQGLIRVQANYLTNASQEIPECLVKGHIPGQG